MTKWVNCVSEGEGAGLFNSGDGTVTLIGCTFENCAARDGGAIYNTMTGNCTVLGTSFAGNQANSTGGAIYSIGALSIQNCSFSQKSSCGFGWSHLWRRGQLDRLYFLWQSRAGRRSNYLFGENP